VLLDVRYKQATDDGLQVAFYGLGLNQATILASIGYGGGATVYHKLYNIAAGNCILICAGAIPGYWLAVATIDAVGRKPLQLIGFTMLTILFIVRVPLWLPMKHTNST
jgi:PHS family inorganic phosphate transporter-like MFS transporter